MHDKRSHVLLIYQRMIPSVRLCGHLQMEHLASQGRLEYRARAEKELTNADLSWADIVILGRLDSLMSTVVLRKLKEAGKKLLYILDDDLLNVPGELRSGMHYQAAEIRKHIELHLQLCDGVISPSPILLDKYAGKDKLRILIEEPSVEPVPYEPHGEGPVKIGFAGSVDRKGDVERLLSPALHALKKEYGEGVQLEFFGAIPDFAKDLGAKAIPYTDSYDDYRRTLNSLRWDIGLAPMPDTPFHACKHYNKFVEYAAAGVVGVYSDVQPYTRLKGRTEAAVFCPNETDAWLSALRRLVENTGEREALRRDVIAFVEKEMSVAASAKGMLRQLPEAGESKEVRSVVVRFAKIAWPVLRLMEVCAIYGWKTPVVVVQKVLRKFIR